MTNGFIAPRNGESVTLICLKCRKHFIGPNPIGQINPSDFYKKTEKAKCPECGSRRVARNPWINY